jgi:hypothetical protein
MTARAIRPASRVRTAIPWIIFGLALLLATKPVWGIVLLGFNPTLGDFLAIQCFGRSYPP